MGLDDIFCSRVWLSDRGMEQAREDGTLKFKDEQLQPMTLDVKATKEYELLAFQKRPHKHQMEMF